MDQWISGSVDLPSTVAVLHHQRRHLVLAVPAGVAGGLQDESPERKGRLGGWGEVVRNRNYGGLMMKHRDFIMKNRGLN